jgi:2-methylisocitrate lyase-like PEP mutase family enzyme
VLARLRAYEAAGADVLYAPGLRSAEQVAAVTAAVSRPVNVLMGLPLTLAELSALGVRRVSTGSALSRAARRKAPRAAREMAEQGSFGFADEAVPFAEIQAMLRR